MPSLRTWIQQKVHSKRDFTASTDDIPPGFPVLDSPRRTSLSFDVSGPPASLFFQKLTFELRRAIYVAAFGENTFHVDLQYRHPHRTGPYHANLSGVRDQFDVTVEEAWRWWSCVCHRSTSPSIQAQVLFDECRAGAGTCIIPPKGGQLDPDRDFGACFVGAMDWLLTCRQAYVEAMDVIYSTNTFFIQSVLLTKNLSRVLVPQNLAFITSFEFKWDILPGQNLDISTKTYNSRGWVVYTTLLSLIKATSFPKLQKLIIIVDDLGLESKSPPNLVLHPSDQIVRNFHGILERFQLQLPPTFFKLFQDKLEDIKVEKGGQGVFSYQRFWRAVPTAFQDGQDLEGLGNMGGYWVFKGVDHHIPAMG